MADAKTATKQILDFSNVKERGAYNPKHKPDGDYRAKIVKVEETTSQSSGNPMWVFAIQLTDDATAVYPYRCVLNEQNLWKVRNVLVACGMAVPKKRVAVDPQKVVGKELGVTLESDEYEGKMKSEVQATFPTSDLPAAAAPASRKAPAPVVADDDEVEDETVEDVADDELEEIEVEEL